MLRTGRKPKIPKEYEPWVNLAAEIVRYQIKDYKRALKKNKIEDIRNAERWIRSKYFTTLTMGLIDPENVIEKMRNG